MFSVKNYQNLKSGTFYEKRYKKQRM